MSSSYAKPKHSAFTLWCRGFVQMLSYEWILSITVYLPPMLFMRRHSGDHARVIPHG